MKRDFVETLVKISLIIGAMLIYFAVSGNASQIGSLFEILLLVGVIVAPFVIFLFVTKIGTNLIADFFAGDKPDRKPRSHGFVDQSLDDDLHREQIYPYSARFYLLTPNEMNFYRVLNFVLKDKPFVICPQVSLAALLTVQFERRDFRYQTYFNRIKSKYMDFVICSSDNFRPLLVVELDDMFHANPDRSDRDVFINKAFEAARLPLLHIPVQEKYNLRQLALDIAPYLQSYLNQV